MPSVYRLEGDPVPVAADRIAVVAHFSTSTLVSRSFEMLVTGLTATGYAVVVSSTAETTGELLWSGGPPRGVSVLRRPNAGYDFGSWAVALNAFPQIRSAPYVLTVNDSMLGPFRDLGGLIESFEASSAPVWGAVRSHQFAPHLQSYFVGYRGGDVLRRGPVRRFWRSISVQGTKTDVIWKYELGLSKLLAEVGIESDCAYDGRDIVGDLNPAILGWRALLEAGFPFIKRELVTSPQVAPDSGDIPRVVREMFNEDVLAWL